MLDWLIIGGGVHGTHLSHFLTATGRAARKGVRVLDPHPQPLAQWRRCTTNVGMRYLRSPAVHNLGVDPFELQRFARSVGARRLRHPFAFPYERPSLELFSAHAQALLEQHKLHELRVPGRARRLRQSERGWRVETELGELQARRVLLAIGSGDRLCWPNWARALVAEGAPVEHIFDEGFQRAGLSAAQHVIIVGGGVSAAQLALTLAEEAEGRVILLSRHPLRVHQFDSDPSWLGRFLPSFRAQQDYGARRSTVGGARHRGSVPPEVQRALRRQVERGALRLHVGAEVSEATFDAPAQVRLRLRDGSELRADRVVCATGFDPQRPGGDWLEEAVAEYGLRCAACGYPIVSTTLQWHPGLYVTGPLAELEIGPAARNIAGARMSAARLAAI